MIVERTSIFNASPAIKFVPFHSDLPDIWKEGEYIVDMHLFGLIPFGRQTIVITPPSQDEKEGHLYAMLDDGHGQIIRQWRHFVTVDPAGPGKVRYTDRIHLRAGFLTPFIWLFASLFFWHRQNRWKHLIGNNFNYQK